MLLAVTGLRREARIVQSDAVMSVSGGGDRTSLERQLAEALREPVKGVVSFGLAGGLAPMLGPGDCVFATRVIDGDETFACNPRWLAAALQRFPEAQSGAILGSYTAIADAAQKARLFQATGALAVDMESHIAARAARDCGLPFIAIRAISDGAAHTLPPAALSALKPDGGIDAFGVTRSLLARPQQIPALIRTARESEKAFATLFRCFDRLGRFLAFPDLG